MDELTVRNVDVLGDTIIAAQDNKGQIWAGIRWFCQGLGFSKGQIDRQIMNIKKDSILSKGASNLMLPTNGGKQEVFCIKLDFVPIWLAKIQITRKTEEEHPELAEKLLNYQLKAKDILAAAFFPQQTARPLSVQEQIRLIAQGNVELEQKIDNVKQDLEQFKQDMPVLGIEENKITSAVRKAGVEILGGKESNAYNDKSLRGKLYSDIYRELKRQFDVTTYKAIKRSQCSMALSVIETYKPPIALEEQIQSCNAQMQFGTGVA